MFKGHTNGKYLELSVHYIWILCTKVSCMACMSEDKKKILICMRKRVITDAIKS